MGTSDVSTSDISREVIHDLFPSIVNFDCRVINQLLKDLENHAIGASIGSTYVGCPTCADDVILLSDSCAEMQDMIDIVVQFSNEHRFMIHPTKSQAVKRTGNKIDKICENSLRLTLGEKQLNFTESTTHLGIIRAAQNENEENISNRITLARKTLYSLIKVGMHGTNGLNPRTAFKILSAYVTPRLMYGLESLHLTQKDIIELDVFYTDILKKIQSLPTRTSNAATYLILGALPINAEIHKRQLSLLFSIINSNNNSLKEIAFRQNIVGCKESFFSKIESILELNDLPDFLQLLECKITKPKWKKLVRAKKEAYWTKKLQDDAVKQYSLKYLCKEKLAIGRTHNVWDTVKNSVSDVRSAATKVRILTGTYMVQILKSKFNAADIDPRCPLCLIEDETIEHMLTTCDIKYIYI